MRIANTLLPGIGGTTLASCFGFVPSMMMMMMMMMMMLASLSSSLSSTSSTTTAMGVSALSFGVRGSPVSKLGQLCAGSKKVSDPTASSFDVDTAMAIASVTSVKNLRPVVPGSSIFFRSATLDDLTPDDAERLLDGSALGSANPLGVVIDLRNSDEIEKGKRSRTEASEAFYAGKGGAVPVEFLTVPVLGNVDAFWEEAIGSMDPWERWSATLQTVAKGGALDRAAARHLERGGLPLLYALTMTIGGKPLATALEACLRASAEGRPVIFHCQKGKDRTGILAMLLQVCLQQKNRNGDGDGDEAIVEAYAMSGPLIGELPNERREGDDESSSSSIDWSYFRGSPADAMVETLAWTRRRYGSVEGYLDSISFGEEKRAQLRSYCRE